MRVSAKHLGAVLRWWPLVLPAISFVVMADDVAGTVGWDIRPTAWNVGTRTAWPA